MKMISSAMLRCVLFAVTLCAAAPGYGFYQITDLGDLGGGESYASAVNNVGQVVGYSLAPDGEYHAFRYSSGVMQDIGTMGQTSSFAQDINDAGQIVGTLTNLVNNPPSGITITTSAFTYNNGTMSLLTGLGGSFDDAFGINSSSQIVGTSELSSGGKRAVIYGSVSTQDLSSLAGIPSNALAINDNGQIVGDTFAFDGVGSFTSSGFSILNGAIQFLPSLGGDATGANDVNNKGDIVGYSRLTNGGRTHAFLYRNGVMQDLGTLTATESAAYAINESGAVVGDWGDTIDTLRGFIYQNGTMTDLNTLIDPASGWLIKGGTDINESGQILVDAVHPVIGRHALLLSPTADTDNDGVPDDSDNCILHANPDQRDTNGDNYGNRCDADLNQSNTVNAADLATFKSRFGTTNADADLDGNGNVNAADLAIFKALFGKAPGPSGVAQ